MNLHFIVHESFEAPGAIELWAEKNNYKTTFTRCYKGENLPDNTNNFDFLVVMGGPQSPATTTADCSYFDARAESKYIKEAIDNDKFVLGVCLGAQLIGESLGAKFDHSPNREIGLFELTLTTDGMKDPIFSTFPEKFMVGHWHGDMPGLTRDSMILASSKGCPRQIVKYSSKVYGFQCHFEFTLETMEGMIKNNSKELDQYKGLPYIENADTLRKHDFVPVNEKLYIFLDYMDLQFTKENK